MGRCADVSGMAATLARRASVATRQLAARTSQTRGFAALSMDEVHSKIASEKVVVFTKSYCKFCRDIVDRLDDANAPVKEVALDSYDNGNHVRDQLRASTGQEHVPYVYIGGKLIVSEDAALALKAPGTKMKEMLEGVGVKATGYFRT